MDHGTKSKLNVAIVGAGMGGLAAAAALRLKGIDAPEKVGVADRAPGFASKQHMEAMVLGKTVRLCTFKDAKEKYGRYLVEIFLPGDSVSVNRKMIEGGFAVAYDGRQR